jgi:hypothetical protein
MIQLSEALKVVSTILNGNTYKAYTLTRDTKATIDKAIKWNLCELIEMAVSELKSSPKQGNQDLAHSLTEILEGK